MTTKVETKLPPTEVLNHIVDVHCHAQNRELPPEVMESLAITICTMAWCPRDQEVVAGIARKWPDKVIPGFGYHPWAAHFFSIIPGPPPTKEEHYRSLFLEQDPKLVSKLSLEEQEAALARLLPELADPVSLHDSIESQRRLLLEFPNAMVGEVGLDRQARIPYHRRGEGPDRLSPFKTPVEHQMAILEAQLNLAVELRRNVSLHSVDAQSLTVDVLKRMKEKHGEKWLDISVDMHSCGLSVDTWRSVEKAHPNAFLSLSVAINGRSPAYKRLIASVSPERLLVESDIHDVVQCTPLTWEMVCTIAEVRGWNIEETWAEELDKEHWGVVRRLEENWARFTRGGHRSRRRK